MAGNHRHADDASLVGCVVALGRREVEEKFCTELEQMPFKLAALVLVLRDRHGVGVVRRGFKFPRRWAVLVLVFQPRPGEARVGDDLFVGVKRIHGRHARGDEGNQSQ